MNTYPLLPKLIHPLPTTWYSPLSQGEKVNARVLQEDYEYIHTAPANCPPETGGTRSEATEGVDKTTHSSLLPITYPPPPHYVVLPLSQGEKVDARSLQEHCGYNFTAPADCPPETGGE